MKVRPLVGVRDRDVFVVQSLLGDAHNSVHDKLWRLLLFIGALRDSSARRITVVAPYLAYGRKDRRTKPRDPVATRQLATLFEAAGTDRVVTIDVHNLAAFENAFRCRTENLLARPLFAEHVRSTVEGGAIVVVSPDVGGMKRASNSTKHWRAAFLTRSVWRSWKRPAAPASLAVASWSAMSTVAGF